MAFLLSLSLHPPNLPQNPNPNPSIKPPVPSSTSQNFNIAFNKRHFISSICIVPFVLQNPVLESLAEPSAPPKPPSLGITSTKAWFQFFGDGFAIRVPPQFEDIMEPEDFNAGLSLYGDKAKPKTFAARFASSDGSEVLSVIIRPTNQLKITFLEAKDVSDLGTLKEAAKIFIPVGATIYSGRTLKVKEDEGFRTYYLYEFGRDGQRVALVAAVSSGKAFIAGATAPESKWDDDNVMLRSAAVSLTVLL